MRCVSLKNSALFFGLASAGTAFAVFSIAQTVMATSYVCPNIGATRTTIVDGTCYGHFASFGDAAHARSACSAIGGKLASIRSSSVNTALFTLLQGASDWIGGGDDDSIVTGSSEGNFFWPGDVQAFWTGGVSGGPFGGAYANWKTGEPNDNFGEDCMEIQGVSGQWNDLFCTANLGGYICEIATVASSSVASGDGANSFTPARGGLRPESLKLRIEQAALRWKTDDHSAASALSSSAAVSSAASSSVSSARSSSASSTSSAASVQQAALSSNQRVVIAPTLYLRSDSRINASVLRTLRKGQLVTIIALVDKDWARVRLPDGKDGFVWRRHLGK